VYSGRFHVKIQFPTPLAMDWTHDSFINQPNRSHSSTRLISTFYTTLPMSAFSVGSHHSPSAGTTETDRDGQPISSPTPAQVRKAEEKAASICDMPHEPGVGCVKCQGLKSAALSGRLTPDTAQADVPTAALKPRPVVRDPNTGRTEQCNSCEDQRAQHEVSGDGRGATGPDAIPEKEMQIDVPTALTKQREKYFSPGGSRQSPPAPGSDKSIDPPSTSQSHSQTFPPGPKPEMSDCSGLGSHLSPRQ